MSTTRADVERDQHEARFGAEVELSCDCCGECWLIHVPEGEDVTYEQTVCPIAGCPGEGEEL